MSGRDFDLNEEKDTDEGEGGCDMCTNPRAVGVIGSQNVCEDCLEDNS